MHKLDSIIRKMRNGFTVFLPYAGYTPLETVKIAQKTVTTNARKCQMQEYLLIPVSGKREWPMWYSCAVVEVATFGSYPIDLGRSAYLGMFARLHNTRRIHSESVLIFSSKGH